MHQGYILHDSLWINTLSKEYVNSLVKHFMHMQRKLSSPLHVSCVFRFSIYSTHSFNFSVINLSKSVFNNIGTLLISLLPMANIITVPPVSVSVFMQFEWNRMKNSSYFRLFTNFRNYQQTKIYFDVECINIL